MSRRRFFWLAVILCSLALYFPINRIAHGGNDLSLPIDGFMPLFPPAVIPYLLGTVLFVGFPVWAALRTTHDDFKAFTVSVLMATAISYVIYLAFPTFVTRPEIASKDVFSKAAALLYQTDKAYNAFPSGHAMYTTIIYLFLDRWARRYRWWWLAGAFIILAAALLTRQHNVMDMVSGIGLGAFAYIIGTIAGRSISKT